MKKHLPRIATFLTLKSKQSKEMVHVINTHYDDAGIIARAESSWLIRRYAHDYIQNVYKNHWEDPYAPIILLGDFSMSPYTSLGPVLTTDSPPEEAGYKIMTSSATPPGGAASLHFMDAFTHLSTRNSKHSGESQPYGSKETYSGFKKPGDRLATRIDFVMLAQEGEEGKGGWGVSRFGVIDNWVEGGVDGWKGRWSDHRLVRATLSRQD
jgi:endonuclease/exonuclease/phosphatase family metal-dependent hydrolase